MNVRQSTLSDYDFYKIVSHTRKCKSVIGWLPRTIAILYNSSNQACLDHYGFIYCHNQTNKQ